MTDPVMALRALLDALWRDYQAITPDASRIHQLLADRGERIVNDHIALRTFGVPAVEIDVLARPFVAAGYTSGGDYHFPDKKLRARHYDAPEPDLPKVFISQLEVECFPARIQAIIADLVAAVPDDAPDHFDFPASGRPWPLTLTVYEELLEHSEYAAWLAAFGFRANHFTVAVGQLRTFGSLQALARFLLDRGFEFDTRGGLVKGSPEQLLEQSSTRARSVPVEFIDGMASIPSCYYEFARRYPGPDGVLFPGFVTASADKLFESTDIHAPSGRDALGAASSE